MLDQDPHLNEQRRRTEAANILLDYHERQFCIGLIMAITLNAVLPAFVAEFLLGHR